MADFFAYPTETDDRSGAAGGDVVLLPQWTDEHWERLFEHTSVQRTRDGQHLITAGTGGQWLYVVVAGRFDVQLGSGRRARLIGEVGPGQIVGELSFLDGQPASADVISRGDGEVLRLGAPGFEAFATQNPALGRDLLFGIGRIVAQRLRATTEQLVNR